MPTLQELIDDLSDCPHAGCFGDGGIIPVIGDNLLDRPLVINRSRLTLQGNGRKAVSTIRQSNFYGPVALFSPNYDSAPISSALVSGSNGSLHMDGTFDWFYNLRDSQSVELNGLSAFTVEFHYKPEVNKDGDFNPGYIISSQGRRMLSESVSCAFAIYHWVNNLVRVDFTIGNVSHTIYSPNDGLHGLVVGNIYHIEFNYDGTTARLFVNGVLYASTACTGTLTQQPHEDVNLGGATYDWPELTMAGFSTVGCVDNVRISSVARHTSTFTPPTAKYTDDASTLMLLTFGSERIDGILLKGEANNVDVWLPLRRQSNEQLVEIDIRDVDIHGQGPFFFNVSESRINTVHFEGAMIGPFLKGQVYLNSFKDMKVLGSGNPHARAAFVNVLGGACNFDNINLSGTAYPFVFAGGSARAAGLYLSPNEHTRLSMLLKGRTGDSTFVFDHLLNDDETDSPLCEGALALDDIQSAIFNGGSIDCATSNPVPLVIVDGGDSITMNLRMNNASGGPILKFLSPPSRRLEAHNCVIVPITAPWTTTIAELEHLVNN